MESKHAPPLAHTEFTASLAALPPAAQLFQVTVPVHVHRPRQLPEVASPSKGDAPLNLFEEIVTQMKITAALHVATPSGAVPTLELLLTDD